jgi:hypothetical protein
MVNRLGTQQNTRTQLFLDQQPFPAETQNRKNIAWLSDSDIARFSQNLLVPAVIFCKAKNRPRLNLSWNKIALLAI